MSKSFWVIVIAGMTTGMGNGSVFGAAVMCLLGRGPFADWGGQGALAYSPATFSGFLVWCMILFGVAFSAIMAIGMSRHNAMEN
ncbi:MAG: hypothetical protein HY849_11280 [Nitrosomonadales bacterium]|nr:hypothetical protein [Nitrosomonadales bacterium]